MRVAMSWRLHYCDDRDHASIVDGRRLSFATQLKYKHNDMDALEKELQKCET